MVETEPMWRDLHCCVCAAEVEVHNTEHWNGLCPVCDEEPEDAPH